MKFIQGILRSQATLFATCLDDTIEVDNEVRLIDAFVDSLKLGEYGFKLDQVENGRPAYHDIEFYNSLTDNELVFSNMK